MLYVAIDHSDNSLKKYIGNISSSYDLQHIRRSIADLSLSHNADGVVLNVNDSIWGYSNYSIEKIIVGFPDMEIGSNEYNSVFHDFERGKYDWISGKIKMGFLLKNPSMITDEIHSLKNLFYAINKSWIFEPYFNSAYTLKDKVTYLKTLTSSININAFKLDLDEESIVDYAKSHGSIKWFSRSDGMNFENFLRLCSIAANNGCIGAIAGAAIWKDIMMDLTNKSNISFESVQLFRNRISQIKNVFS